MQKNVDKNLKNFYMPTPVFSKKTYTLLIFLITYSTFTSLHSSRAAWSYSKHNLELDPNYNNSIDEFFLGTVDMIFMLFYGIGLFISGYIGDKFSLKKMLVLGMSLSTFFFFLIFLTRAANDSNHKAIIAFMCFNGLFQSTGFPACVTILGNWINKKTKGKVYGLWSSCHNIGNIVGFIFGMIANDNTDIGWHFSILFASLFMLINTLLIAFFVVSNPKIAGFQDANNRIQQIKSNGEIKKNEKNGENEKKTDAIAELKEISLKDKILAINDEKIFDNFSDKPIADNFSDKGINDEIATNEEMPVEKSLNPLRVCIIPGVFFYAILNVCIKILVVSLLLWLPIYLKQQNLDHHAANIVVLFEFGQIIGAFLLGYFCDKLNKRASLIMPVLLINVLVFIIVGNLKGKEDLPGYYLNLFLVGILLGGPSNLIAAMISQDISQNKEIKEKNKKIASTLVGIIDGSGYIGVALTQLLIPYFLDNFFLVMILFLCFSSAWISPKAYKELKANMDKNEKKIMEMKEMKGNEAK